MSEFETANRLDPRYQVTTEDIRELTGASTPHFALQIRNRIGQLIRDLPADDPARIEGERETRRLETLALKGARRGGVQTGELLMPSLGSGAISDYWPNNQ